MSSYSRIEGYEVPVAYTVYESTLPDYDPSVYWYEKVPLVEIGGSSPCWIPCIEQGEGYLEPHRYVIYRRMFEDETYLEYPFKEIKDSYRIRSKPYERVGAFALDYEGLWQPVQLQPVIVRIEETDNDFAALAKRGVIPRPVESPTRFATGPEVHEKWRGVRPMGDCIDHVRPINSELGRAADIGGPWG